MKEKLNTKTRQIDIADNLTKEGHKEEKKLDKSINEYLKEHGIEAPPISVHIFYSGHSYGGDLRGFHEIFKNSDIVIPEAFGWRGKNLKDYKDIASGKKNKDIITYLPHEVPNVSFDREFLMTLHGTNKKIALIDVPQESETTKEVQDLDRSSESFFRTLGTKDIEESVSEFRGLETKKAKMIVADRDRYMLEQLGPKIEDLLKENPDLLKHNKLGIMLVLGATHTGVYHELKAGEGEGGSVISRSFRETPQLYHYSAEVLRRFRFNRPVSDELLLKDMFEGVLSKRMSSVFVSNRPNSSAEYLNKLQSVVDKFSIDEIKMILRRASKNNFNEYLNEALKRKGVVSIGQEK